MRLAATASASTRRLREPEGAARVPNGRCGGGSNAAWGDCAWLSRRLGLVGGREQRGVLGRALRLGTATPTAPMPPLAAHRSSLPTLAPMCPGASRWPCFVSATRRLRSTVMNLGARRACRCPRGLRGARCPAEMVDPARTAPVLPWRRAAFLCGAVAHHCMTRGLGSTVPLTEGTPACPPLSLHCRHLLVD